MRHFYTALAYLVALILTAVIASFAVLFLVGPHGGALPQSFYMPVLVAGWAAVIVLPLLFARWMWRRLSALR
jgi:hypothetical protein